MFNFSPNKKLFYKSYFRKSTLADYMPMQIFQLERNAQFYFNFFLRKKSSIIKTLLRYKSIIIKMICDL